MKENKFKIKTATNSELNSLQRLSTERLIIWVLGKSKELNIKLSKEDIVIECWMINPEKHAMRGYQSYPDSNTVMKRIGEMKGKKGLLKGSEMGGYSLTEISDSIYADIKQLVKTSRIKKTSAHTIADRTISSIDEAPYKRLRKTPAYLKFKEGKANEIVETDYLYFYGINWHSKKSFIQSRIKNTDTVVNNFTDKDKTLKEVHLLLNDKFQSVKQKLLNER
jgi:hypothetical protein